MLGSDADSSDVSARIGLEQPNYKARHGAALRDYSIRNRFRRGQQIFKSVAAIRFAVDEASLIEAPTLIELGNSERPQIVARINRRHQSNVGLARLRRGRPIIRPAVRSHPLDNSHIPAPTPLQR